MFFLSSNVQLNFYYSILNPSKKKDVNRIKEL